MNYVEVIPFIVLLDLAHIRAGSVGHLPANILARPP